MTGPAPDSQAYTGFAGLAEQSSEWNRLQFMIRSVMAGQATTTLVQVKAVSGDPMTGLSVDVQPMVAQTDGAGNAVPHGTIHGLPVWRVQGGVSAVIVVPVVGDIGLAVFASTDISGVKRKKAPTTPGSARRFDWADGIYLGGLLNPAPTQFVRLDDTGVRITSLTTVTIDAPGGLVVNGDTSIAGKLVVSDDIQTGPGSKFNGKAFDGHLHSGVTTGGGNSGPPV